MNSTHDELEARLFSADPHVIEPTSLWADVLDPGFWPDDGAVFKKRPGGHDPEARIEEMAVDGVTAEVLYPTLALKLFALDDADLQADALRVYNDWLIKYCAVAPDALVGVGAIPVYDIDRALTELHYCHDNGLQGCMIWQSPHPDLPFSGTHYDPVWAEAVRLRMPISFHILTGHDFSKKALATAERDRASFGADVLRNAVNLKLLSVMELLYELLFAGVLQRHPDLQLVLVENEAGWLPFVLDQWDYYYGRFPDSAALDRPPSELFTRQIYVTFIRDRIAAKAFQWWGHDNAMWSSDYPHGNSTWPESRAMVQSLLGDLPVDVQHKLVRGNVEHLYRR